MIPQKGTFISGMQPFQKGLQHSCILIICILIQKAVASKWILSVYYHIYNIKAQTKQKQQKVHHTMHVPSVLLSCLSIVIIIFYIHLPQHISYIHSLINKNNDFQ